MTKRLITLILALAFCLALPANADIVWVSGNHDYNADGVVDDFMWVDLLVAQGYTVDYRPGNWTELDEAKIAALNAADLVIISRCTSSGDYNNGDEPTQWNAITAPMLSMSTHLTRSNRWKWFNTTGTPAATPIMQVVDASHPIFAGAEIDVDGMVVMIEGPNSSFPETPDAGNGTVLAKRADTGDIWIATWEAGAEYYSGAGQIAGGPRMFMVAGTQEAAGGPNWGEMNLAPDGVKILLNAIAMYTAEPPIIAGVVRANGQSANRDPIGAYDGSTAPLPTEPGGLMDGNLCYSDRTYPWSLTPAEMIGSEYVRTFNNDKNGGETDVTYTVTTSRRAIIWITVDDRIPAEWTSGGTINSPQDAADRVVAAFAGPGAFTDTGIDLFVHENATTDRQMSVYSAILPAGVYVFDSMDSGKNFYTIGAMPIPPAEPVDVTSPGDAVKGVPDDGDWPAGEYPALAIDNKSGTKFLHRKGGAMATGIAVTPSAGPTLVTGLTFTTANDVPTRDPIAYELSGSNVSIDGPFEVIASGDIVDFAGTADWPRFTKNTTPIAFDNKVAYEHYKIVFPALRGATQTLMQIAEIELLGSSLNAFAPTPPDGAVGVPIDAVLSWSAGAGADSQDVYFGTEVTPPLIGNQFETKYNPGPLEYGTTYFWRIDTVKADGSVQPGYLWSFTTTIPVGIFEYSKDIGDPAGVGKTVFEGYVWKDDMLTQQYLIQAGGSDIWGVNDQFQFAYNEVSGNVRISAGFDWVVASNQWAKYGVMLRKDDTGPSVNYCNISRRDNDLVQLQWRESQGASSSSASLNRPAGVNKPKRVGIQRVEYGGLKWIEAIVDWGAGNGWEPVGSPRLAVAELPDEILAGVCVTSHDNTHLSQARAYDVTYELNPSLIGTFPTIPAADALAASPSNVSGFKIRSLKSLVSDGSFNTFAAADELLDTGMFKGLPAMPGSEGTRVDEFVNLRDTGNGAFSVANGYPDKSYPGIDPLEDPAQDPAAGDDDNDFATEILGYIHLMPGVLYKVGANSDDGTYIVIGSVEVVRTAATKGTSNVDSNFFQAEVEGYYPLKARHLERGGGASIELHQVLLDGTRILLNDVANGGTAVFAAP